MKATILLQSLLIFLFSGVASGVKAAEVDAIPLIDLMRDYSIVSPVEKIAYGTIEEIKTKTDPITNAVSIREVVVKSNKESFEFSLSKKAREIIKAKSDNFAPGLEVAFRIGDPHLCKSKIQVAKGYCEFQEVFLSFNKVLHKQPNIERPRELTVEEYFSLGVLYENLPVKITGVISSNTIREGTWNFAVNNTLEITSPNNSSKKITCVVGKSFLSEDEFIRLSKIIYQSKPGDEVSCDGVFAGGFMDSCAEINGLGYFLCTKEILTPHKWTQIGESNTFRIYLDFDRIENRDGYVYFWALRDFKKTFPGNPPNQLSDVAHFIGDCSKFRSKRLIYLGYNQAMGLGVESRREKDSEDWRTLDPDMVSGFILKSACDQ